MNKDKETGYEQAHKASQQWLPNWLLPQMPGGSRACAERGNAAGKRPYFTGTGNSPEIAVTIMDWQSNFIHVSTSKSEGFSHLWKSEGSVGDLNTGRHAQTTLPLSIGAFFQSVSGIGYDVQVFKSQSHRSTKVWLWIPSCFRIHISLEDRACLVCILVKCWLPHLLCLFADPVSIVWTFSDFWRLPACGFWRESWLHVLNEITSSVHLCSMFWETPRKLHPWIHFSENRSSLSNFRSGSDR